jgi:hypothetical protein
MVESFSQCGDLTALCAISSAGSSLRPYVVSDWKRSAGGRIALGAVDFLLEPMTDLVADRPARAPAFQRLRLDFIAFSRSWS